MPPRAEWWADPDFARRAVDAARAHGVATRVPRDALVDRTHRALRADARPPRTPADHAHALLRLIRAQAARAA